MGEMNRYRTLFLEESRKHIEAAQELLLQGDGPGPEALDEVFRQIHSLKGMAASMGYEPMAELSHRLEDLLDRCRAAGRPAVRGEVDVCVRACDRLLAMRDEVAGGNAEGVDWSDIEAELASLGTGASACDGALTARITLSPSCTSPAARAYLILLRFREHDPSVSSTPTEEEILQGRVGSQIELALHGLTRSDVEEVTANLTEVEGLSFEAGSPGAPLDAAGSASAEEASAPAGGEPVAAPPEPRQCSDGEPPVRLPETVQAPVQALEEFVDLVGEMTIIRSRLEDTARVLGSEILREDLNRLGSLVRSFHERVMGLRMLPFSLVTSSLKRLVRDLSPRLGKEVEVRVSGEDIGMDKSILLQISDPLVHLVRNALDHGLESPEERLRNGKPARGLIEIQAQQAKRRVEVAVIDDGRGIDEEAVRSTAVEKGIFREQESRDFGSREVLACLFRPGFSTRASVTELSGRGVGLDVVKTKVDALGGTIEIASGLGKGTEIRLGLPLSVAIVPVLLVAVGANTLALPVTSVVRTLEAEARQVQKRDGRHVLLTEHGSVPILSLARILRLKGRLRFERMPLVLLQASEGTAALAVDRFVREEDLFIKPLRGPLRSLPFLSGYSILGDGCLVFLLDPAALIGFPSPRPTPLPERGTRGSA